MQKEMKFFTYVELSKSMTAKKYGIDNTPDSRQKGSLYWLVVDVLDPIRKEYGKPIYVNSAFRSDELNTRVGGKKSSQHLNGEAADITLHSKKKNEELFNLIVKMQKEGMIQFDQLIDEKNFGWIHISYCKHKPNRNQILHLS